MKAPTFVSLLFILNSCFSQQTNKNDTVDNNQDSLVKLESIVDTSDLIVLLSCSDSTLLSAYPFTQPDSCRLNYEESLGEIDNKSRGIEFGKCTFNVLSDPKNEYKCDTIYVAYLEILVWIPQITTWEDQFFRKTNDVYNEDGTLYHRIEYYSIEELKGVCVTGFFRMKSKEFWKDGKRHGVCQYFYTNGELKRTVEYELGKIIRETQF